MRALASRLDSWTRRHMWVEFVVGSLPCSARFFSGYSGSLLSFKSNISKFQFDFRMHGHFSTSSCELLGVPWVNKLHFFEFGSHDKFVSNLRLMYHLHFLDLS